MRLYFRNVLFFTVTCFFAGPQAVAMTEKEATDNLMYFAFAGKQAELCQTLGFPGEAMHKSWLRDNSLVMLQSIRRLEEHAATSVQATPEEALHVPAALFVRFEKTFDREFAPKTGKASCMQYRATLRHYESKLVKQ